ncbi:MAG: peptidoglycan binding domain-containing protein, partial [Anaerolineae bacterium]|nr:peptidoglycan binding domain-containing protein [Anaerolineae bacterium]
MQRQSPPPSRRPARPKRKPRTARQRRPAPSARAAYPPGQAPYLPPGDRPPTRRRKKRRLRPTTIMLLGTGLSMLAVGCCVITLLGGFGLLLASDRVLPGVSSVGVDLGSMTEAKAAQALTDAWVNEGILLRDGERVWAVSPADIGISLDANATAAAAKTWGRSNGGLSGAVRSLVSGVEIDPVLNIDMERLSAYLQNAKADTDIPATNAGVQLVNGQAEATPPENGREMDANATANVMRINAADELADGALDVVMIATFPTVTDATPLVAQANALLSSPFTVEAYDPVTDDRFRWSA